MKIILFLFVILGNHEYYTIDVHNWMKKLASMGIHVLHNENVKLPSKGDSVCLAGVNDPLADEYRLVDIVTMTYMYREV